jgi:hypothetical protein
MADMARNLNFLNKMDSARSLKFKPGGILNMAVYLNFKDGGYVVYLNFKYRGHGGIFEFKIWWSSMNLQGGGTLNMADTARSLNLNMVESINMAVFVNLKYGGIFKNGGKFKFQDGRNYKMAEYLNMAA